MEFILKKEDEEFIKSYIKKEGKSHGLSYQLKCQKSFRESFLKRLKEEKIKEIEEFKVQEIASYVEYIARIEAEEDHGFVASGSLLPFGKSRYIKKRKEELLKDFHELNLKLKP